MMIVRYKTYDRQGTMQLYEEWLRSGEEKIAVGDDFWFYLIKSYCDDPVNVDVAALLLEDAIRENAMVRRKTVPVRTFNIVIQACAQDRRPALALTVIDRMRAAGVNPTDVTYLAALRACASAAKIDRRRDEKAENDSEESLVRVARTLIVTACTEGIQPTSKMWSAALHVCALCGDVAAATEIFADMRASGSAPNVHSCTALMRAYASVRDLSGAIDAYWTMRNEFDVAPDSSTLQTMLEVVRAAGHNKSRGTSDVISRVQEVYADMRALNVRPNNAVLSLLTESVVEDVLALGSPNSAIDVKRLTLAIDGCVSVESEITQTWDDIASMNLKEYSVAEARVAFLGLLQTLRDRRAARLRVGDVRVGVGRGKIRDSIETLARDVSLMLSYAEDDDGVVVLTSAAIEHWFAKP
jgi:pentatricopeptide repeat protein